MLESRTVQPRKTSAKDLRQLISYDLVDAAIEELSADRRFATAYNAMLKLSKTTIACAGYKLISGSRHYRKAFGALKLALGKPGEPLKGYFETCRRKPKHIYNAFT